VGKIVLAEFGYGGKLLPSFPTLADQRQRPSRLAWLLKEQILPPVYWKAMLGPRVDGQPGSQQGASRSAMKPRLGGMLPPLEWLR
jgi:hypothetical protein